MLWRHNSDKWTSTSRSSIDSPSEAGSTAALGARRGSLLVLYGRRRLGKSRLLLETLAGRNAAYYVGDDRAAALQIADVARGVAGGVPGFDEVEYPEWNALLERWERDAPRGAVLALDEFPSLARRSPELPSLIQKLVDRGAGGKHVVLCGSSQRMMHGLVLDGSAPLYGRAREILRIEPLEPRWLGEALGLGRAADVVEHWAAWGGVPRYWELARGHASREEALRELVLDPRGVLHREPDRLLRDEMDDLAQAASILSLVGRGAHRSSEIAGRLGSPATALSRPLALLVELGLLERELPWGRTTRDSKRTRYRIADPFLRLWFRFVDPARSRLGAGLVDDVAQELEAEWPHFLGGAWGGPRPVERPEARAPRAPLEARRPLVGPRSRSEAARSSTW